MKALVLLDMVADLTGVELAPITAIVTVKETTGDGGILAPLIAKVWITGPMSRFICAEDGHHAFPRRYLPRE